MARVIILGAGRPDSRVEPPALVQTPGDRQVLDWILESFKDELTDPEFYFVGGYRIEEIVSQYPDINFSVNPDWENSGVVESLFSAPLDSETTTYLCYADTVFDRDAVARLVDSTAQASVVVDEAWRTRYRSRPADDVAVAEKVSLDEETIQAIGANIPADGADAEFTGLVKLSPSAVETVATLYQSDGLSTDEDLPALLTRLNERIGLQPVRISGSWAELNEPADLIEFALGTKAETLRRIRPLVERSAIVDQHTFTVGEWEADADAIYNELFDRLASENTVIVRSSTLVEDGSRRSHAGEFETVLDVPIDDKETVLASIEEVVDSYPTDNPDHQVLVQPMIADATYSGVIFTRTLNDGPYYVLNFDDSGSTESVTDGTGSDLHTVVIHRDVVLDDSRDNDEWLNGEVSENLDQSFPFRAVLRGIAEIEDIVGHTRLDIEFAIEDGQLYVLQVRPIPIDPAGVPPDSDFQEVFDRSLDQFEDCQAPSPFTVGDRTIFGVMPDWNPAEIIGRQPGRLAVSLYRYLILDDIWARQRAEFGYRDIRPQHLLWSFLGQPYVDVRAIFNSFIPSDVPDSLAEKLVTHYLDRLERHPELHDKVEFDVAITCLAFNFEDEASRLRDSGFTDEEIATLRDGLESITTEAYERTADDLETVERLTKRFERIEASEMDPLRQAITLLEDCKRFGTLPFAHLARSAFVAITLLRSLEQREITTEAETEAFLNSLETITREFEHDGSRVATGELEWDEFVDKYGHLRPGTYDITSPTYAEKPDQYLEPMVTESDPTVEPNHLTDLWDEETCDVVEDLLPTVGLPPDIEEFERFLRTAIEGREYAKFKFTRNLSRALEHIEAFGRSHDIDPDTLAHVSIFDLFSIETSTPHGSSAEFLQQRATEGRKWQDVSQMAELPPLLTSSEDFYFFERPNRDPNYCTDQTVRGEPIELCRQIDEMPDLEGHIVLIPQADPGFDWIFGHNIAGLVTKFGGANSHMAIRAAEFSVPAAIGVGEMTYEQLRQARLVELDCSALRVERLE